MDAVPGPSQQNNASNMPIEVRSLVLPSTISKSSKDPHRGLYPQRKGMMQTRQSKPGSPFQTASEIYDENANKSDENVSDVDSGDELLDSIDPPKRRSQRIRQQNEDSCSNNDKLAFQKKRSHAGKQSLEHKQETKKPKLSTSVPRSHELHEYFDIDLNYSSNQKQPFEENTKSLHGVALANSCSAKRETSELVYSDGDSNDVPEIIESPDSQQIERNDKYYFGLFGATETCEENNEPNYFEWLPVCVIEQILCQVPFLDVIQLRRVSKLWKLVIDNEKFLEWKKAYYRLKKTNHLFLDEENTLKKTCTNTNASTCFLSIIRFMSTGFHRTTPMEMLDFLKKGAKYTEATEVLAERVPNEVSAFTPWSILACMVILSETVEDVFSIVDSLLVPGSPCSLYDVFDALYCIATQLLYYFIHIKINHGLHYRLYHVLYTYENAFPRNVSLNVQKVMVQSKVSGQQSIHKYCHPTEQKLTYEQIRILNHRLGPKQIVKIVAFAGTGKTTTLIHYTRLYPQLKFLNVVFNKAVCEHAKKLFPHNVECRTIHSLAYRAIGKNYRHKLRMKLKPHDIAPYITTNPEPETQVFTMARLVLDTIEKFTGSSDPEITIDHVPVDYSFGFNPVRQSVQVVSSSLRLAILQQASQIWEMMIDPDNREAGIVHDTYLKLYQLSHPVFYRYDCIMIDEAQDSDAAMLDIVLSQDVPVIFVGDPNQQIYGFRGANNALSEIQGTHVYHLTKSFRFGPEIAYVASCCIEVLKNSLTNTIVGTNKESHVDGTVKGQYAIVSRTKLQLFQEAMRLCCTETRHRGEPQEVLGAFVGGFHGYNFDQLLDLWRLFLGGKDVNKIKDKFLKRFISKNSVQSIKELTAYAKQTGDSDMIARIELIRSRGTSIVMNMEIIKRKCGYPLELANVIFTTAHKAKGLEFDSVYLTEDFFSETFPLHTRTIKNVTEEYNILYVALTRAKYSLVMSGALNKVLISASEKFEYPVSSKKMLADHISLTCCACSKTFIPHTVLIMKRRDVTMSNNRKCVGGPLCMKCAAMPKFRPEVHREMIIMFLDYVIDHHHCSMAALVGPLPDDDPIKYDFEPSHQQILIYENPHNFTVSCKYIR